MATIALTLGLLLTVVIALLSVPLTVIFSVQRIEQMQSHVRFRWLFGLVRFQVRIPPPPRTTPKTGAGPKRQPKKKDRLPRSRRKRADASGVLSLLKQPAFRRRIYRFLRDLLAATHARDLLLRLRIGTGDPADTGRLWAFIGPLAGMAQNLHGAKVRIEPEFMQPLFEVESHGRFRLLPIQFIALTVAFMLSPTMLRAWWSLHREEAE